MNEAIAKKIQLLEDELALARDAEAVVTFKGIWKGVVINESDFLERHFFCDKSL